MDTGNAVFLPGKEETEEEESEEETSPAPTFGKRTVLFRMELLDYVRQMQLFSIDFGRWLQRVMGNTNKEIHKYVIPLDLGNESPTLVCHARHYIQFRECVAAPLGFRKNFCISTIL